MIPSNPLLAIYILGIYGWATLLMTAILIRPMVLGAILDEADRAGIARWMAIALFLVLHTIGWPLTVVLILATNRRD